jgi:hypothetical protein
MRMQSSTRFAALAALTGALACAGNKARTEETNQPNAAAARDTTTVRDTTMARDTTMGRDTLNAQNPPGYRGMERDTTIPSQQQTPTDTFLQRQGERAPQDTAGYSGMERVDTTGQNRANPADTTGAYAPSGAVGRDTTGVSGMDTTRMRHDTTGGYNGAGADTSRTGAAGLDTTGKSRAGDTTGYQPSQQSQDTTTSR